MKITQSIIFVFIGVLLITTCTEDIDDNTVVAPSDFYYLGDLPIPFYTNGSRGVPNID